MEEIWLELMGQKRLGKMLRRSGKKGPYVHILICIRCYVVVAISKHKGMLSINFNKM